MYKLFTILTIVVALSGFILTGCVQPSSETNDQRAVSDQQDQYRASQPVPTFDYSTERDAAIQLYNARNENVNTHTVWRSDYGMVEFDCPSIGYPIPYDTSLTNPEQVIISGSRVYWAGGVVEQAEPNGLFASKNSIATWVRCTFDGKITPIYIESKVTTFPFPVQVDYTTNRITRVANAKASVVLTDSRKQQ